MPSRCFEHSFTNLFLMGQYVVSTKYMDNETGGFFWGGEGWYTRLLFLLLIATHSAQTFIGGRVEGHDGSGFVLPSQVRGGDVMSGDHLYKQRET